jgi:Phosphopantetheine attachment site
MTIAERLRRLSPAHQELWRLWTEESTTPDSTREQLVAFVVERAGQSVEPDDLRLFLQLRLPVYMVPSQIVKVLELPRAASGKLARSRLRISDGAGSTRRIPVAPRNAAEQRLVALFEQVLQQESIGVFDDFFSDLGGHSLLATLLVSAIRREWQRDVPLRLIFEHPTIAALAEAVDLPR